MEKNLRLEQVWKLTQTHKTLGSQVQPKVLWVCVSFQTHKTLGYQVQPIPLLSVSGQWSPRLCLALRQ